MFTSEYFVLQEKEICTIDTLERESNIYLCTFYDRWTTQFPSLVKFRNGHVCSNTPRDLSPWFCVL